MYFEIKKYEGIPGIEPGTCWSATNCSTTELYPHLSLSISYDFLKFILQRSVIHTKFHLKSFVTSIEQLMMQLFKKKLV